jgi:hypothetical protein
VSVNFNIFDFFSRTTGLILTKLGTNHPWEGRGFNFFLNEGWRPPLRGDNSQQVKIHKKYLKIFFLRTRGPISIKFG